MVSHLNGILLKNIVTIETIIDSLLSEHNLNHKDR